MTQLKTTKVSADEARNIIPGLVSAGEFYEASWETGRHFADADYAVGEYVTAESNGDYTDHPRYSGVNTDYRPDDMPVAEWIISCLPKIGQVVIRKKHCQ